AVPALNHRNDNHTTPYGHTKFLHTDILDHLAVLDASATAADEIVIGNKIDDHSTAHLYSPNGTITFTDKIDNYSTVQIKAPGGGVTFNKEINNHSTIRIDAPNGVVTFNKEINGQSKLYITARRVVFMDKIDGGKDTLVDITLSPGSESGVQCK